MKYSLRSLMIVVTLGPPLLAAGWAVGKAMLTPRYVNPGRPVVTVDWEKAKAEVKAWKIEKLRAELAARNSEPAAP